MAGVGEGGHPRLELHEGFVDGFARHEVGDDDVAGLEGDVGGDADGLGDDCCDAFVEAGGWGVFEVGLEGAGEGVGEGGGEVFLVGCCFFAVEVGGEAFDGGEAPGGEFVEVVVALLVGEH